MAQKWILAADDEVEILSLYCEQLEPLPGVKLVTARDGAEAYKKSRLQKFDLIITDYRMPKLNGAQLISALRENPLNANTPIYVISGYIEEVKIELEKARLMNKVFLLDKPVSMEKIEEIGNSVSKQNSDSRPFTVDVKFLNPYMNAIETTLKEMARLEEVTPGKPYLLPEGESLSVDISSNLAVLSEYFSGTLVIGFPRDTFVAAAAEVLGEAQKDINSGNRDLVGELANIIFGKAKVVWNQAGYSVQKAIPSVIDGSGHQLSGSRQVPSIVVPYQTSIGPFSAIITVQKSHLS